MLKSMKALALLLLAACCAVPANAGKPNVFIDYFSRSRDVSANWAEFIRNNVMEGILELNRVNLIDVDSDDVLRKEQERRNSDNIDAGDDLERLAVMTQQGANYLITGQVISVNTEKSTSGDLYNATASFTLKIINPKDGQTIDTQTFNLGTNLISFNSGSTPEEAVMTLAKPAKKAVRGFIENNFVVRGSILEITETKKGEAKQCYIDLGSEDGLAKDAEFNVCLVKEVKGRRVESVIGSIKVKAIEGVDISLCEVKKGGKEIQNAFDANQELVIKSKSKKAGLLDKVKDSTGL